jgi:hypothetical protein
MPKNHQVISIIPSNWKSKNYWRSPCIFRDYENGYPKNDRHFLDGPYAVM